MVFADTSVLLPFLDGGDNDHGAVAAAWRALADAGEPVLTTNYVLVETFALAQRRLGMDAVRDLAQRVVPALGIEWVDAETHDRSVAGFLAADRRSLSLVDCASFVVLRRLGITRVLSLDPHFREQGYECLPSSQ